MRRRWFFVLATLVLAAVVTGISVVSGRDSGPRGAIRPGASGLDPVRRESGPDFEHDAHALGTPATPVRDARTGAHAASRDDGRGPERHRVRSGPGLDLPLPGTRCASPAEARSSSGIRTRWPTSRAWLRAKPSGSCRSTPDLRAFTRLAVRAHVWCTPRSRRRRRDERGVGDPRRQGSRGAQDRRGVVGARRRTADGRRQHRLAARDRRRRGDGDRHRARLPAAGRSRRAQPTRT